MGGDHLNPVDKIRSATLAVVGDTHRIDAVDRRGKLETGIEATHATAVIVANKRAALRRIDIDDRIERRPQDLGEGAALEDLPLLERHPEAIDVAGLLDDTIEGVSLGFDGEGSRLEGVVRLGLKVIVHCRKTEEVAGRRGRLGLWIKDELGVILGR